MGEVIIVAVLTTFAYMTCWFGVAYLRKRNDVADVAWGLGFMALTSSLFLYFNVASLKHLIAIFLVALWGMRLATHISQRHAKSKEDARYVELRKKWRYKILQAYTNVFLLQGFFLLLVATPILLLAAQQTAELYWYNYLGLAVWVVGFSFESIGDYQLKQFIANAKNEGKIMQSGLWKYTRHPNYFGEISLWWGFYVFTLFTPYWYVGIIGPLTITFLILGVSGIPMLEARYKGNKEYNAYKKRTSAFFPLPSKAKS